MSIQNDAGIKTWK